MVEPTKSTETILMSFAQVRRETSLSKTTINRLEKIGRFPKRIKVGHGRRVAWLSADIREWVNNLIRDQHNK